jgi:ribosome-associated protein
MTRQHSVRHPRALKRAAPPAALELAVLACEERKAVDGVVLDLRTLSDAADFFVVVSGTSDTHVRAIAEHVMATLAAPPQGARAHHVEGLTQGRWVLLDYVDFVVHVFHPSLRSFYQLEGLWGDAPRREIAQEE